MADDEVMVRAVKAHKVYNSGAVSVHALRGIDLDIRKGEMVAVMGPSGCGKTTLLNCLSGLDDLSEGEVFIEGVPLNKMSDRAKTRYRALRPRPRRSRRLRPTQARGAERRPAAARRGRACAREPARHRVGG